MHGIQIFWKRLRIFKILAVIVTVPVLLLALLLMPALPAWADANPPVENEDITGTHYAWRWQISDSMPLSYDGSNPTVKYKWYRDVDVYLRFYIDPSLSIHYQYGGFIRFTGDLDIQATLTPRSGTTVSDLNIPIAEMISISALSGDNRLGDYSTTTNQYFVEAGQVRRNYIYSFNLLYYFYDWNYVNTRVFDTIHLKVRFYFENSKGTGYDGTVNVANNVVISETRMNKVRSDNYYLYNINENIKNSATALNTGVVGAINTAASQAHTDAVTAHNDSVAEKNAINTAASQAHSDAQNLDNHLMNDSSSFSSNTNSFNNQVQTAQQAADQAVDNAVHSYEAQLDVVSDYDAISFFRDQSLASTFWRDVGEYILSTSNLGYFAAGLIVVTIIGLFVFLLRL